MRSRLGRASAAAIAAVLTVLAVGMSPATPAAHADDPTWAQVQAAKKSVKAKASEIATLQAALDGLEAQAAQLGTVALEKAAVSSAAASRLRAAQTVYDQLESQTNSAAGRARSARRTAATVATQLARGGDPTISVWLAGEQSGSLLYRLGALAQISDASSQLLAQAVVEQRDAKALGDQAQAQAQVRDGLAKEAKEAANVATMAEQVADRQVAQTKVRRARLTAQLAALQSRSSALAASYAQAQAAKRAAAAAGNGGGGGALAGIGAGPDSLSPAGAQAYASSRLGAYGWSSGQMSCLISLWNIESGWRWNAYNASSGAYGIPQSLPGSKMATAGGDWTTSSKTQIEWGLGYIQARYSTPCGAYAFETSHVPYWY